MSLRSQLLFSLVISVIFFTSSYLYPDYTVKVKDIVYFDGVKKNVFMGYGLVVGLAGSGDTRSALTRKSLRQFLEHSGVNIDEARLNSRNIASVAVFAELSGFYNKGDLLDVSVASIDDAKNIDNGLLLPTALKSSSGEVFIVASGVVNAALQSSDALRGNIISGGVVEKTLGSMADILNTKPYVTLVLKKPSFQTVSHVAKVFKASDNTIKVEVLDNKHIRLVPLAENEDKKISHEILSKLLNLEVKITAKSQIVINKQTGVIVVGDNVRIEQALVVLPRLSIEIEGDGDDKTTSKQDGNIILKSNTTVKELADGLISLGVEPKELVAIFSALSKSGAINANIILH